MAASLRATDVVIVGLGASGARGDAPRPSRNRDRRNRGGPSLVDPRLRPRRSAQHTKLDGPPEGEPGRPHAPADESRAGHAAARVDAPDDECRRWFDLPLDRPKLALPPVE